MTTALLAAIGVALDAALGEPRRWHPLVGFGAAAKRLERRMLASPGLIQRPVAARLAGVGAVAALVVPPVAFVAAAIFWIWIPETRGRALATVHGRAGSPSTRSPCTLVAGTRLLLRFLCSGLTA